MKMMIKRPSFRTQMLMAIGLLGVALVIMFAVNAAMISNLSELSKENAARAAERDEVVRDLVEDGNRARDAAKEANSKLAQAGEATVPVPPAQTPPPAPPTPTAGAVAPIPGKDGRDGRDAPPPSLEQIGVAVAAFCRDNGGCRGPSGRPGEPGKDGKNITAEQAAAAIAAYCDANGQCRGDQGDAGPGPSDAQIAAGVAAYCADGACRGEPGKDGQDGKDGQPGADGKDGAPGKDGRGITDAECVDGRWRVTYTDGTTDDNAGACAPQPGPTTTVTVTPTPTEPTQEES